MCEIIVDNDDDDDDDYDDNNTKQEHFHEPYTASQLYSTDQVNNMNHENKLNISNWALYVHTLTLYIYGDKK